MYAVLKIPGEDTSIAIPLQKENTSASATAATITALFKDAFLVRTSEYMHNYTEVSPQVKAPEIRIIKEFVPCPPSAEEEV